MEQVKAAHDNHATERASIAATRMQPDAPGRKVRARLWRRQPDQAGRVARERHVRAVYQAMACAVMAVDGHGVVIEANVAAQDLLGLSRDMLLGRTLFEATGPSVREDGSALPVGERPTGIALATGRAVRDVVFGLTRLDGTRRWIQADAVPMMDAHGAVRQVVTSFVDVSARKSAEERLRASEQRFRSVAESAHDAIVVADAHGAIVSWNGGAGAMFGYTAEQVIGQPLTVLMPGRFREAHERGLERATAAGAARLAGQTVELVGVRANGEEFPIELALSTWTADGRIYYTGIIRDITERTQAAEALHREREFLRVVLERVEAGIVACDAQGTLTLFNGASRDFHGLPAESIPPEEWADHYDLYGPDGRTPLRLDEIPLFRALSGEHVQGAEMMIVPKGGQARRLLASGQAIHDTQGHKLGAVVIMHDVTARMHAEAALRESAAELERSNAELQQFAYVASHDLQEPLRTISSYLQLLSRRYRGKILDETADEFIDYAVEGAGRMQALIRAVLDYSRIGTRGKAFAPVDCNALVGDVVDSLQSAIDDMGARITCGDLPIVCGDDAQLVRLFQNLIGNALKFRRAEDAPEVSITAERAEDRWLLRVRDNGIGIAPEHAERIFQMFQRLHTRTEYEGTGIGLAVCRRIVERHGGRIWVESEPGAGATFLFTLPGRRDDGRTG